MQSACFNQKGDGQVPVDKLMYTSFFFNRISCSSLQSIQRRVAEFMVSPVHACPFQPYLLHQPAFSVGTGRHIVWWRQFMLGGTNLWCQPYKGGRSRGVLWDITRMLSATPATRGPNITREHNPLRNNKAICRIIDPGLVAKGAGC